MWLLHECTALLFADRALALPLANLQLPECDIVVLQHTSATSHCAIIPDGMHSDCEVVLAQHVKGSLGTQVSNMQSNHASVMRHHTSHDETSCPT